MPEKTHPMVPQKTATVASAPAISRRRFLQAVGGLGLATMAGCPPAHAAGEAVPAKARPNILFIMVDEMRHDVMGCAGHKVVKTPNLDSLAARSTRFTTAYTVAPICAPSRRSAFTGRYAHVHNVTDNGSIVNDGEVDLTAMLKFYGYVTAIAGKLHFLPQPCDWGFDYFWSNADEGNGKQERYPQFMERKYGRAWKRVKPGSQPWPDDPLGHDIGDYTFPREDYETDWITDRSVEFLRAQKDRNKPFFLFTSYKEPHSPYRECEPYAHMYDPGKMVPPPIPEEAIRERRAAIQAGRKGPMRHLVDDPAMLKALMARYFGHVTNVDDNVGRLLGEVERLGLLDNTVVIFTADHGNMLGEKGRFFKGSMYEGSTRIPLMIRAPQKSPQAAAFNQGKVIKEVVENIDLLPTLFEMTGLPIPPGVQGQSLIPLVEGKAAGWKNRAFAERGSMMVREGKYKLIPPPKKRGAVELYDLEADPLEDHNLAGDPALKSVVARLTAELERWQQDKPAPIRIAGMEVPRYFIIDPKVRAQGQLQLTDEDN